MINGNGLTNCFLLWDQGLAPFSLLVTKLARSSKPLSLLLENMNEAQESRRKTLKNKPLPEKKKRGGLMGASALRL